MDRQLLERMIGAGVLVVLLILVVPAILTGPEQLPTAEIAPPDTNSNLRQLTIRPDDAAPAPPTSRVPPAPESSGKKTEVAKASETNGVAEQLDAGARPEPPPKPKPAPKATAKAAKATAKPPAAEPKPPAKKAPPPKPGSGWVVQLGSFASKPNAEGLASKVKAAGYQSYLVPLDRDGKTLYRVRVGPPDDKRSKAEQLAGRLARAGYRGQVTRQEAGG